MVVVSWWCFLAGVDPKSILCEFFKAGQCQKGFKCKFSHDLNIQRKGEKIDIYSDKRDEGKTASVAQSVLYFLSLSFVEWWSCFTFIYIVLDGNMEEWDQETLEKVVESKKNEYNQNKPTDIVSCFSYFCVSQNFLLWTYRDLC